MFYYLCSMDILEQLARIVLPSELLDDFEILKVSQTETLIEIWLDERYPDSYRENSDIESKGFMPCTTITDFPIRDHKVLLHVRRRRWRSVSRDVSFCRPIKLAADGTCYSAEFASFLKETYGEFPCDLPYA